MRLEVDLHRLHGARQVGDDEHRGVGLAPEVREHLPVGGVEEFERAATEHRVARPEREKPPGPMQERKRRPLLRFDIDGLIAVDRIGDWGGEQFRGVGLREPAVSGAAPLHGRADAVAVAEVDVVAHADLVAVVDDRRARQRAEQLVQQLDAAAAVLDERREPPPDPGVEAHLRVGRVGLVHVVAFFVGDHLERELVVVPQEERPLTRVRNVRRLVEDLGDGVAVLLSQRHEHARHQREMEGHVAFVPVAEIRPDVGRPLVRLGEQHAAVERPVELAPHALEHGVRFRQVLVVGAFAHAEVGHRVQPQAVHAEVQPELHDVDDRVHDGRIVVVEIGLVREEAMPVVLPGHRVPRPVRPLRVREDDARLRKPRVRVAPDVEGAFGRPGRRLSGALEPRVLVGCVVDDKLEQHADAPLVRGVDERPYLLEGAVAAVHAPVVGDVVPVVLERRGEERQQPEAGDPEIAQVVEPGGQARKVTDAIAIAVEERPDVRLVDDRVLVPERIGARPSPEVRRPEPSSWSLESGARSLPSLLR